MGRKKKSKQEVTIIETPAEETKTEKISSSTNSVGYKGTIKISVKHDGRTIKHGTYHNSGSIYLFDFLSRCITGEFNNREVPKFIKLFSFDSDNIPEDVTTGITVDSVPIGILTGVNECAIEQSSNQTHTDDEGKAILHFTIPGSSCMNNSNSLVKIYQLGLYSQNNAAEYLKYSASFNLLDESGKSWEPISFNLANGEYNIYIEWTLAFSNKA